MCEHYMPTVLAHAGVGEETTCNFMGIVEVNWRQVRSEQEAPIDHHRALFSRQRRRLWLCSARASAAHSMDTAVNIKADTDNAVQHTCVLSHVCIATVLSLETLTATLTLPSTTTLILTLPLTPAVRAERWQWASAHLHSRRGDAADDGLPPTGGRELPTQSHCQVRARAPGRHHGTDDCSHAELVEH